MQSINFSGLWYLNDQFAERMQSIIVPRLSAGYDAIPNYLINPHPSAMKGDNDSPRPRAGTLDYYQYFADAYRVGSVCVVPMIGAMSRYGQCNWGTEDLAGILKAADKLESVSAHLLKSDGPGGTVDGTGPLADVIAGLTKPVVAWTPYSASAHYYVISQADEIWMEDQTVSEVGSIGVLMVYVDQSAALAKAGYSPTIFRADGSTDKALVNGIEPLSDGTKAEIVSQLNAARRRFVGAVRRGRGQKLSSDEVFTGKMYGPKEAIRTGLADRTGTLEQAIRRAAQLGK
ncbi:S49 family peptidase [uncultured Fibrella sp.]|uniref:S49 family peptidase n=1 Tax=uncultured Fibrella sp. TaxID=1284596 RepID=UPI0035CA69CF